MPIVVPLDRVAELEGRLSLDGAVELEKLGPLAYSGNPADGSGLDVLQWVRQQLDQAP